MSNAWGGRFQEEMTEEVEAFNQSIDIDARIFYEDIKGSIAHASMLKKTNILSTEDAELIINGLNEIIHDYENRSITFSSQYEDIHLNIEKLLIDKIGPTGGKLHTGRSRNDQVATDMHLFARNAVKELIESIRHLQSIIIKKAKEHIDVIMPGYTHLQRAQPVLFAHHLMTYYWMLDRDISRLKDALTRLNHSPLGSGALAGTTFPIDQHYCAQLLEFDSVYHNSMDGVSDRDYMLETMGNFNLIMIHLSRFSEEIILWSSQEFNFITLSDIYATGSSIMPQKKNPDMAELVRGKSGTVSGKYVGLLMTLKGLPLTYNKDLQEDKKAYFESFDDTLQSVKIFAGMVETMTVNKVQLDNTVTNDFSNATELADYLVTLNVPFRKAHAITGQLVYECIESGILLKDVTLEQYQSLNSNITEGIYAVLQPKSAIERRINFNGTSTASVLKQITTAEELLENTKKS